MIALIIAQKRNKVKRLMKKSNKKDLHNRIVCIIIKKTVKKAFTEKEVRTCLHSDKIRMQTCA